MICVIFNYFFIFQWQSLTMVKGYIKKILRNTRQGLTRDKKCSYQVSNIVMARTLSMMCSSLVSAIFEFYMLLQFQERPDKQNIFVQKSYIFVIFWPNFVIFIHFLPIFQSFFIHFWDLGGLDTLFMFLCLSVTSTSLPYA